LYYTNMRITDCSWNMNRMRKIGGRIMLTEILAN